VPWARLDDDFHDNGKILSLSHPAFRLYVCAITYCRRHRTEGLLTPDQADALCRQQRVPRGAVAELVERRAWHPEEAAYRIHDFADYQPRPAATNAARQQRYRAAHKGASNGVTPVTSNGPVTRYRNAPVPIPNPMPMPTPASTPSEPSPQDEKEVADRRGGTGGSTDPVPDGGDAAPKPGTSWLDAVRSQPRTPAWSDGMRRGRPAGDQTGE